MLSYKETSEHNELKLQQMSTQMLSYKETSEQNELKLQQTNTKL